MVTLGLLCVGPLYSAYRGWGLGSERDAHVVRDSSQYCPPGSQDMYGKCTRTHRSYFRGRSGMGGGIRGGK
jgi:hypothetical protein